jgi:hypothetical protein
MVIAESLSTIQGLTPGGGIHSIGIAGGSTLGKAGAMGTRKPSKPDPAELGERAVRLVREPEAEHAAPAAIRSSAEKIGCNRETLRLWVRQAERDPGRRAGPSLAGRARPRG